MTDAAGATLGVEEEYHLIDPATLELKNCPELSERAVDGSAGPRLRAEMLTSQLEAATDVCTTLDDVRRAVIAMRAEATAAAEPFGATILATSTHPFASLSEVEIMKRPRYAKLVDRFGTIVGHFNLCGCHVHVSVPDLDTAVAIMNLARPYLPLLGALTGSSPFHEGQDTGYESFRLQWLALWPQGGPPPYLPSARDHLAVVEEATKSGLVDDASSLLWDLRPSSRYPTLEFRVGDVCTDIDDVVLYAGIVRSLVRVLAGRVAREAESPTISDATLRAARWRASRFGLSDTLWSPTRADLVPAHEALEDLMDDLRADLDGNGELNEVSELLSALCSRGTSAVRQRENLTATGSLREVTRMATRLTALG